MTDLKNTPWRAEKCNRYPDGFNVLDSEDYYVSEY